MADDGASGPTNKKRVASRQISKDDASDPEEETPVLQDGASFQRASDEVLATRKIVRVRRNAVVATPSAPNPFAGINLRPPSPDTAEKASVALTEAEVQDENASGENEHVEKKAEAEKGSEKETDNKTQEKIQDEEAEKSNSPEEKADTNAPEEDKVQEIDPQKGTAAKGFAGFGTGFSASSFSFGTTQSSSGASGFASFSSASFGSLSGSPFAIEKVGEGGFPSLFGKSNGQASLQFPAAPSIGQQNPPPVTLQEVPLETGEEQEKVVFSADGTLFEFNDSGWKERGKGELKVNVPEDKERRPRLVMRSKGNYRLLLNASLFPDMKLASMDNRGITFACVNSAVEGKKGLTTYAVRLKDALTASSFKEVVDTHKGEKGETLKTPDNSPRASHDSAKEDDQASPV